MIERVGNPVIIMNGGDPLPGCPDSWEEARAWEEKVNADKEYGEPKWRWDCGFKLDFDGPLVDVSSRFYPPKTHYGSKWNGTVDVRVMGEEVSRKDFEEDTLEDLRKAVEAYAQEQASRLAP